LQTLDPGKQPSGLPRVASPVPVPSGSPRTVPAGQYTQEEWSLFATCPLGQPTQLPPESRS
jgi:hypothetical protein